MIAASEPEGSPPPAGPGISASPLLPGAAVLALAAAACGGDAGFAAEDLASEEAEAAAEAAEPRTLVRTAPSAPELLVDYLEISGRLEPRAEVLVASELGGAVEDVFFDKGDRVAAGQLLARIGSDLLQADLAEAEADLEAARSDFDRLEQLVAREAAPEQELTSARAALKREEARADSARLRYARSEIRAPTAGVVILRELEPGEVLAPGSPVALVHDVAALRATIGIPENDIAWFRVGSPAEVWMDAYPDRSFTGTLRYIAPAAASPGRNFPAEIELDNRDGVLRSGLIVRTRLERRRFEDAVVLSRDVFVERDGDHFAFVLDGGRAFVRPRELGPEQDGAVVVFAGLQVGETLIVQGHRNLLDGQPVAVAADR